MIDKLNKFFGRIVGPNSAHVIDGLVAYELTAAGAASQSQSARDFALHHPTIAVIFVIAPPILTAVAAKFRKAASKPAPAGPVK